MNPRSCVIASHVLTPGIAHDLRDYILTNWKSELLFTHHPIYLDKSLPNSGYEYYSDTSSKQVGSSNVRLPGAFQYLFELFLNCYWVISKTNKTVDVFVGLDNLNALAGIVLKKLGRVNKTVYYVIDYDPNKYKNQLANQIYHLIDRFCVKYCDSTWNLSPRMIEARKKYFHFSGGNQIVVPIGIHLSDFKPLPFEQLEKKTIAYMGTIEKRQGIHHIIECMPELIKNFPDFHFMVIGGGIYLDNLIALANSLGVTPYITFTGYVKTNSDVRAYLSKSVLGVALYEKYTDGKLSLTTFADPGKIKFYFASGLPVLITGVPHNANEIEKMKCGQIVELDRNSILRALLCMLKDEKSLMEYRNNASQYVMKFDWERVFDKAFKETFM